MERGLTMVLHASVLAGIAYAVMVFGIGTRQVVAENRSVLIGCAIAIYMVLFGHGLPTSLNPNL